MLTIFHDRPYSYLDELGPPTAPQPKLLSHGGVGYRVFKSNPVSHVITPGGDRHSFLTIQANHRTRPVEHSILEEVDRIGYRPVPLNINPGAGIHTNQVSRMFGHPDTRFSLGAGNANQSQSAGKAQAPRRPFAFLSSIIRRRKEAFP